MFPATPSITPSSPNLSLHYSLPCFDIAHTPCAFGVINGIAVAVLREIVSVDVSEGFHRHVIAADPARSFEGRHLQPGIDLVFRFQPGQQHIKLQLTDHANYPG